MTLHLTNQDAGAAFIAAQHKILAWIEERLGLSLGDAAWSGQGFIISCEDDKSVESIFLGRSGCWAIRFEEDDDRKSSTHRWATEFTLIRKIDRVILGLRIFCSLRSDDATLQLVIPSVLFDIAGAFGAVLDSRGELDRPWVVRDGQQVDWLIKLIRNPRRRHDVCLISLPPECTDPERGLLSPSAVIKRTFGAAHVAVITAEASFILSNRISKEFSAFLQAVRLYSPGCNPDESNPLDHPLFTASHITNRPGGRASFENHLVNQILRRSVMHGKASRALPTFERLRHLAQDAERQGLRTADEKAREALDAALSNNRRLTREIEEQQQIFSECLATAEGERDAALAGRDAAREEIGNLKARIDYLEGLLQNGGDSEEAFLPASFAELEAWAARHLAGKVFLHGRAIRAAKKSPFADAQLAYRALLVLRDHYVPMRKLGGAERRAAYEAALSELGLSDEACFYGNGAALEGETYFIEHAGERCELDRHLKGSPSRDPRRGFRLYFFWDGASEQVVVGSLPNHLKTRIS